MLVFACALVCAVEDVGGARGWGEHLACVHMCAHVCGIQRTPQNVSAILLFCCCC